MQEEGAAGAKAERYMAGGGEQGGVLGGEQGESGPKAEPPKEAVSRVPGARSGPGVAALSQEAPAEL